MEDWCSAATISPIRRQTIFCRQRAQTRQMGDVIEELLGVDMMEIG